MKASGWLYTSGVALIWAMTASIPRAFAVAGVGDTVVVVQDFTAAANWAEELGQWTTLINRTTQQIQRADELVKYVGDPEKAVHDLFSESVPTLMKPLDDAIGLETRQEALNLSRGQYLLRNSMKNLIDDANKVEKNYQAFGQTVERDPNRYLRYAFREGLYARYKQAVDNEQAVVKKEAEVQRDSLEKLKKVKTETEVALLKTTMTASKQRQDMAHQLAVQAKGELDAFDGQLVSEDAKKAEAEREWAQGLIDRMREKALAAYKAQVGAGGTDD